MRRLVMSPEMLAWVSALFWSCALWTSRLRFRRSQRSPERYLAVDQLVARRRVSSGSVVVMLMVAVEAAMFQFVSQHKRLFRTQRPRSGGRVRFARAYARRVGLARREYEQLDGAVRIHGKLGAGVGIVRLASAVVIGDGYRLPRSAVLSVTATWLSRL